LRGCSYVWLRSGGCDLGGVAYRAGTFTATAIDSSESSYGAGTFTAMTTRVFLVERSAHLPSIQELAPDCYLTLALYHPHIYRLAEPKMLLAMRCWRSGGCAKLESSGQGFCGKGAVAGRLILRDGSHVTLLDLGGAA